MKINPGILKGTNCMAVTFRRLCLENNMHSIFQKELGWFYYT